MHHKIILLQFSTSTVLFNNTYSVQARHLYFTMVCKICVPCNFGIENMYDPFHGNVTIEFNNESKIKVNFLILVMVFLL